MNRRLRCLRCHELKVRSDFPCDNTRPTGVFPWCKKCHVIAQRGYKKIRISNQSFGNECRNCKARLGDVHPNRRFCSSKCLSRFRRLKVFGLTPEDYQKLIQSGTCPICYCKPKRWAIDHNHKTGETTGAVCTRCNMQLLMASKHDIELVKRLQAYLENPPVRVLFGTRRYVGTQATSQLDRMWLWTGTRAE